MPTEMCHFARLAAEYGGVNPDNEEDVDLFYQETLITLSKAVRAEILQKLLDADN